jgi:hypothetical protein
MAHEALRRRAIPLRSIAAGMRAKPHDGAARAEARMGAVPCKGLRLARAGGRGVGRTEKV